jgi:hypothetical protein
MINEKSMVRVRELLLSSKFGEILPPPITSMEEIVLLGSVVYPVIFSGGGVQQIH